MNMVPHNYRRFIDTLALAVQNGDVSQERIDNAVREILKAKFALGLFENPNSNPEFLQDVGSEEHRAVARQAVSESQVLLKNENQILPLPKEIPYLFVAGAAADDIGIQSGGWTIEWQGNTGDITPGTTILEAIKSTVSSETVVVYDKEGRFEDMPVYLRSTCIGAVGEEPYAEGIGDSAKLRLPNNEMRTLVRMQEVCDELIVVLLSGRPLIITDLVDNWDALVAGWLPGTEAQGVADVLFGKVPFVGKLSYSWPRAVDQLPFDFDRLATKGCEAPLFPFGYGLTEQKAVPIEIADC